MFDRRRRGAWLALAVVLVLLSFAGAAVFRPPGDARTALLSGDYEAAHGLLLELANAGDAPAQTALAGLYLLGLGVPANPRTAADWYLRAALQENPAAQVNLGHLYNQGRGVPRDPLRAFAWYSHAQQAGSRSAEGLKRVLAGGWGLTPNQLGWVEDTYARLEDLTF